MNYTIPTEDRPEPRIEVIPPLEEKMRGPGSMIPSPQPSPKRSLLKIWGPALAIALIGLGFGLWSFVKTRPAIGKTEVFSEIKEFRDGIQKLTAEGTAVIKEIETIKAELAAAQEQIKGLKEQVVVLARKPEKTPERKTLPKSISYRVKRGDSLATIAKRFRVRPEDLRQWNQIPPRTEVKPGRILVLRPSS
jgi:LysM repeat protein